MNFEGSTSVRHLVVALLLQLGASVCNAQAQAEAATAANGRVPDARAAIKVALEVWIPRYGRTAIDKEAPYSATLTGEVWRVEGTLAKGAIGGVAVAELSQADGHILRVSHGQ